MSKSVSMHKGYFFFTLEHGKEKGIFFRSPIQKIEFVDYGYDKYNPYKYLSAIKNPIKRFYEILIGNGNTVKNLDSWVEDENFAGFEGNILCSPIYFSRFYKRLKVESVANKNSYIRKMVSYGYESEFETVSGGCKIEKTTFLLNNGKKVKFKKRGRYYFTYNHIVREIIDSGIISDRRDY